VEQLTVGQKIEKGLQDSQEGKLISEVELEQKINKWFD